MYDDHTVAFEIRSPFRCRSRAKMPGPVDKFLADYREPIITIWHVEPRQNSCPWFWPEPDKNQRARLDSLAFDEEERPYFTTSRTKHYRGSRARAEMLYRALLLRVADCIETALTFDEAASMAARAIHGGGYGVDPAGFLCFLPGYHTNFPEERKGDRRDVFFHTCMSFARQVLQLRRPWYRSPRWHFWHWEIQIHPIQKFKRWAFSRCKGCGKGFAWGESVTSGQWYGTGPRWFHGEEGVYHNGCYPYGGSLSASVSIDGGAPIP